MKTIIDGQEAWDIIWKGLEVTGLFIRDDPKFDYTLQCIRKPEYPTPIITITKTPKPIIKPPKDPYEAGDWKEDEQ